MQELSGDLWIIDLDDPGGASPAELITEAVDEIKSVRPRSADPQDFVAPCVVVLTSQDLHRKDAQRIVQAGGFVCRKPEGLTEALRAGDQKGAMDLLLGGADWSSDWPGLPGANQDPGGGGDLSVYEQPPFQLDADDYDRWLERMRTPPERLDD